MDELLFRIGRTSEYLQIWIREVVAKVGELTTNVESVIAEVAASEKALVLRDVLTDSLRYVSNVAGKLSELTDHNFFRTIIDRIASNEKTVIYAIFIGFTVGSGVGFFIGFSLKGSPKTSFLMRGIATTSYNSESIALLEDLPLPKLYKPNQILIEVKFASIDHVDLKISNGYGKKLRKYLSNYNQNIHCDLPLVLGRQGSGVVVDIGSKVESVEIGSGVFFCSDFVRNGCLSEYVVCDEGDICKIPSDLRFEGAASLAFPGVEAWNSVVLKGGLSSKNAHSKSIFVHCASTGSGWMVIQLCAAFGARVTASSTSKSKNAIKALGATYVHTVESGELLKHKYKYDIVFNTVGPVATEFCQELCDTNHGIVIDTFSKNIRSDNFGIIFSQFFKLWIKVVYGLFGLEFWKSYDNSVLEDISKLVDRRLIQPNVDKIYFPEEIENAINNIDTAFGSTLIRFDKKLNGTIHRLPRTS